MDDIICRAKIETSKSKVFKIIIIALIILVAIFFIPTSVEEHENVIWHEKTQLYNNIFGSTVYVKDEGRLPFIYGTFPVILFLFPAILVVLVMWKISWKNIVKRCSLQLTNDEVSGNRKYFFSNKSLKLPIEKVDSISVESAFLDKLLGGQTIAIRSASGLIRFVCVQNAEEFVNKTLEAIKAYKPATQVIQESSNSDELAKITKLKEMLDSGIITQEEFDTKKKQLLNL